LKWCWIAASANDWLESHFIATFLAIAVVAIGIAIWWEWRHDDPVVELTLLRERNFAIANLYYFLFAFGLFGSTVLIPEILQTLFGYTATDAGLALGPGAAVVTILAPFVVRIVPRVGAKRMLGFSFTIAALSFFYYRGMTTGTDYFHFALARCFQGFGYAFMFIPVSQLAYSYLPKNKNNKGSSLTNLCRNWGASFGIAFVTTMLERRAQYHQSVLVSHLTSADGTVLRFVSDTSRYLLARGTSSPDAIHQSYGLISSQMTQQATMLAAMDCFHLLGLVAILGLPRAFLIRNFAINGSPRGGPEVNSFGPLLVYAITETIIHEYFAAKQSLVRFAVGQDGRNLRSGIERVGLCADTLHRLGIVGLAGLPLVGGSRSAFRASEDPVR
jgi:DHA2 family multidrug resistance protein